MWAHEVGALGPLQSSGADVMPEALEQPQPDELGNRIMSLLAVAIWRHAAMHDCVDKLGLAPMLAAGKPRGVLTLDLAGCGDAVHDDMLEAFGQALPREVLEMTLSLCLDCPQAFVHQFHKIRCQLPSTAKELRPRQIGNFHGRISSIYVSRI